MERRSNDGSAQKKRKRVSSFPTQFDLDKYEKDIEVDGSWWAGQLSARKMALMFADIEPKWLNSLAYNAAYSITDSYVGEPVRVATFSDLEFRTEADCKNTDQTQPIYENNWLGITGVVIDCTASDEAIMQGVMNIVNETRKNRTDLFGNPLKRSYQKKITSEAKVKKLLDYQVLPFLDILIWEKKEKVTIDRVVLISSLFPTSNDDPYKTYEKVKKFALSCTEKTFIQELATTHY